MKQNKNLKKFLVLLFFCISITLIYQIIHIYAVFYSEVEANVELKNGVWNITINGEKITTGTETEFTINQITTTENEHVKPGKLAPGLSGSFEMIINPQNTNVSVRYDITLNKEELGDTNLKIKSIEEIEKNYKLVETSENTYTGIIPLEEIQKGVVHKIKMEIEWVDNGESDEIDSQIGTDTTHKFQIPITIRAVQYLGEEI